MSVVSTLPRKVVRSYLSIAKLPVTAVARVNGEEGNEQWPPVLAFESLEAGVESVIGSILRDEELVETGRLRKAKVEQLRKAAELEVVAEQTRVDGKRRQEQAKAQAEQTRQTAEQRAEQQKRQAEADAERAASQAAQKAARKTAAAREAAAKQEEQVERRERANKLAALEEERKALATQQAALSTEERVRALDDAIDS